MDEMKVKQTVRRLSESRALLVRDYPFFGHLALGLKLACAPCGTACTDGSRLIIDPAFAERLSERELQFVILHEVLHCVLSHCSRGKSLNSLLYNTACDMVVNSTILDMWGLDTFEVAGNDVMHLAPDGQEGRRYNAEEIYHMLLKRQKPDKHGGQPYGSQKTNDESGQPYGSQKTNDEGGQPYGSRNTNADEDAVIDRHDLWQGIRDKSQLQDIWNEKIRSAAKTCGDTSGMPQSVRREVQELADRSELDWKQLLHDFLQYDRYDYTFIPPDRRYSGADFCLPAFNVDEEEGSATNLWVCVDTSGSISDEELASAMAEICDAMRQAGLKGYISFFDSNITEPEPFETETELRRITPAGGGGTIFQIIFDYLQDKICPEKPGAILIFTDGYARWPEETAAMDVPVLWLISRDGAADAPWGRVVKLR